MRVFNIVLGFYQDYFYLLLLECLYFLRQFLPTFYFLAH